MTGHQSGGFRFPANFWPLRNPPGVQEQTTANVVDRLSQTQSAYVREDTQLLNDDAQAAGRVFSGSSDEPSSNRAADVRAIWEDGEDENRATKKMEKTKRKNESVKRHNLDDEGGTPNKKQKVKQRLKRRDCSTCCNEVPSNRFPKAPHKDAHEHGHDVCFKCWEQHLHSQIEGTDWDKISCAQCGQVLEEAEFKKLDASFTTKFYEKWLDKAAKACRENDEEFRECPKADCSWGCFMSTKANGNIFSCRMCQYRYCIVCEAPMHEDQTCEEYQTKLHERQKEIGQEEEKSKAEVAKTTKQCPKCKSAIWKDGGCAHMTCKKCKHEFCWLCFADYNGPEGIKYRGNSYHQKTCKYHSDNLPAYQANMIFPTMARPVPAAARPGFAPPRPV